MMNHNNRMAKYFDKVEPIPPVEGSFFSAKKIQPGSSVTGSNFIVTAEGTFDLEPPKDDEEYFEQP